MIPGETAVTVTWHREWLLPSGHTSRGHVEHNRQNFYHPPDLRRGNCLRVNNLNLALGKCWGLTALIISATTCSAHHVSRHIDVLLHVNKTIVSTSITNILER